MLLCNLSPQEQRDVFSEIGRLKHISAEAVEKDWWVSIILKVLFTSKYAPYLLFKGGTSLSKGWHLIERFSEDIDIAIDRVFLGYEGELSKNQVSDRLRRSSCNFVRTKLKEAIEKALLEIQIPQKCFDIHTISSSISTVDPETIIVEYFSVYSQSFSYTSSRVLIEAGARSMISPYELKPIQSFVSDYFPEKPFADIPFYARVAPAERTFLEKLFLLHEEFHKPIEKIRFYRMSRHLYDIERMMNTPISQIALTDKVLYKEVVEHRQHFIGLRGFDYDSLYPSLLNFIPPKSVLDYWEKDYRAMQENIIYGESLEFNVLIHQLKTLNEKFRGII